MIKKELNLAFKGDRNYLHGTDIFDSIERILNAIIPGWLKKLTFKKFTRHQCEIVLDRPEDQGKVVSAGQWMSNNGNVSKFWVIETSLPITGRIDFNEEEIYNRALSSGSEIRMEHQNYFKPIECIVVLTKKLSYDLNSDMAGQWVFGQIYLNRRLPRHYASLKIIRVSEKSNRFSRNQIVIDGSDYGEIRFIIGAP